MRGQVRREPVTAAFGTNIGNTLACSQLPITLQTLEAPGLKEDVAVEMFGRQQVRTGFVSADRVLCEQPEFSIVLLGESAGRAEVFGAESSSFATNNDVDLL